ncbi:MAG TPA: VOC family protein [Euzebyales bacterium]|nr:VOC family protein [Euzebyales bacterium]
MTTISYWADDVSAARDWYCELLGTDAYFQRPDAEQPAYVEFRVGDHQHELGIVARSWAPDGWDTGTGGAILYWHVDDLGAAIERLLAMGATTYEPVTERGPGFVTAAVTDPFGNVLGVMYNQHYLDRLALDAVQPAAAPTERSKA